MNERFRHKLSVKLLFKVKTELIYFQFIFAPIRTKEICSVLALKKMRPVLTLILSNIGLAENCNNLTRCKNNRIVLVSCFSARRLHYLYRKYRMLQNFLTGCSGFVIFFTILLMMGVFLIIMSRPVWPKF